LSKKDHATVVILAAGNGSRMRSQTPKVLHKIADKPMIGHVLNTAESLEADQTILVLSPGREEIKALVKAEFSQVKTVIQEQQLGTGHAVLAAREHLKETGKVLVLFGDTPLIKQETLQSVLDIMDSAANPAIVVMGMRPRDRKQYGRIIRDKSGVVSKIVEHRDATPRELSIPMCNSGVMGIKGEHILNLLDQLQANTTTGEFFLTDIVEHAVNQHLTVLVTEASEDEVQGVNSRAQLALAEQCYQNRRRQEIMAQGVTLIDPNTVYFSYDTEIAQDVIIHPNVYFGPGVEIEQGVEIKPFTHIEGAKIKQNAVIGPFARIRPQTTIEQNAKVGNFVEIKNSHLSAGVKANHLSYIGDAEIGEKTNIGAGTITCNYDGQNKWQTTIGKEVMIGSNTSIIAPLTIGDQAYIGAGSTLTKNVDSGTLAMSRTKQANLEDGARRIRQRTKTKVSA